MKVRNRQTTIKNKIWLSGTGLHSGSKVGLEILPASENSGIKFIRADINPDLRIRADYSNILKTDHATTIGIDNCTISTIEHLMAAVYALGIDNILIKVYGPEIPVMDGSSQKFVKALMDAETVYQNSPSFSLNLKRKISISHDDKFISIEPFNGLYIDCSIDFDHPLIKKQIFSSKITKRTFIKNICMSRTFGFLKDVEMLKRNGLALGGSLENAIVVDNDTIVNKDGLRSSDEFVKHKVLDIIGDLALTGFRINGRIKAVKTGHKLHAELVNKILTTPSAWDLKSSYSERLYFPLLSKARKVAVAV